MKIPIMLIVGDKEMENNSASIRRRHKGNIGELNCVKLMADIKEEINKRSI